MKVAGFTFIKNAIKYDFPVCEAIASIMPLCDVVIVAVGDSEDETRALIEQIDGNIIIIDTVWDESLLNAGAVLADETNKAIQAITKEFDWCVYIQGDEVMHEQDVPGLKNAMKGYLDDANVDGLLFEYNHFYGSYDYIGSSSYWYRHEIRIFKNNRDVYSYRDAQGFRKGENQKLKVKPVDAHIYHYGWVKPPEVMLNKVANDRLVRFGIENSDIPVISKAESKFDYSQIDQLRLFQGSHPKVMEERIARNNWKFDYDISKNKITLKERLKHFSERVLGYQIGEYRNYKIVCIFRSY